MIPVSSFIERVESRMVCYARNARIGVALSGGADSVALLAALSMAGFRCVALHCNFHLRGDESMRDQHFAREVAERFGAEWHCIDFDVEARRSATGESVEMACRELRYQWFADMAAKHSLAAVAIGHHREDRVETFFLNAMRGAGLRGLSSMRTHRDIYVRPMLDVTRTEIEEFLSAIGADYITDSSNLTNDYSRNRIRNIIIPELETAFPHAQAKIAASMDNLERTSLFLDHLVEKRMDKFVNRDEINVRGLALEPYGGQLLFEWLRIKGYNIPYDMVTCILEAGDGSGKQFGNMRLDRGILYTNPTQMAEPEKRIVNPANWPFTSQIIGKSEFHPVRDPWQAWFDASILEGDPVFEIRPWQHGDRITPFGRRASKLVSDLFNDAHYIDAQKRATQILTRNGTIIWIPGLRQSAHFAVTPTTASILHLVLK